MTAPDGLTLEVSTGVEVVVVFSRSKDFLMRATSSALSDDMWLFTSRPSERIFARSSLLGIPTSLAIS